MEKILKALGSISKRENIDILYACESGSRAWGFASTDSDYDVRFIYRRPVRSYVRIERRSDCIDRQNGELETREYLRSLEEQALDVSGWDINKVFYLMSRGNPQLAEWLISPIIYMQKDRVAEQLKDLSRDFYKTKAAIYHYEHMAQRNFNQYILNAGSEVILKKYLYVLRPVYACAWIQHFESVPPMVFEHIYTNSQILSEEVYREMLPCIQGLIERKRSGKELGKGPHIPAIDDSVRVLLDRFRAYGEKIATRSFSEKDMEWMEEKLWEILNEHLS